MIWSLLAKLLARPAVTGWLIRQALKTPYTHIEKDGSVYMERYWLFNPYPGFGGRRRWGDRLPSVRLHKICRPDQDRHPHDHPWEARTIILRGGYEEERMEVRLGAHGIFSRGDIGVLHTRYPGDTATLSLGEYHRITWLDPDEPTWTMFITWRYQGTWGFLVDGAKVPWRKYLGLEK